MTLATTAAMAISGKNDRQRTPAWASLGDGYLEAFLAICLPLSSCESTTTGCLQYSRRLVIVHQGDERVQRPLC